MTPPPIAMLSGNTATLKMEDPGEWLLRIEDIFAMASFAEVIPE